MIEERPAWIREKKITRGFSVRKETISAAKINEA